MSGITPLLDTLLHQVLGKRVDTPPARDLNQPVKPTSPADAPRAVHSDSRLDARTNPSRLPELGRTPRHPSDTASRPIQPQELAPPSAQTHFSSSARTIADLLVRFPAPPSIVTSPAPLMAIGQAPDPTIVATRLEDSIRHSGLFYESHLARWYKGELPRQELQREPQMWRILQFAPSGSSQGSVTHGNLAGIRDISFPSAPLLPHGQRSPSSPISPSAQATPSQSTSLATPPATGNTPLQASSTAVPPTVTGPDNGMTANIRESLPESAPRPHASQAVQESLQGIVRHQLEMLVTPALRWEGDVWSGLFMALMIQLPPGYQDRPGGEDTDQQQRNAEQQDWRSEIDLDIAGLGRLKASLCMKANSVEIDLRVAHDQTRLELENGIDRLRTRLAGHGFEEIRIDLDRLEGEPTP